ncbi:hypothetical protein CXR27_05905 [Brevibacterium aurantiacum]|uniref:Phospholipase A2 domain-containing protein n=1 Tax=Brevibacterium aurantiacum TaxID=273384 RepID=A0A3T0DNT4_BREAU|nr:hypothetical protein CXR27_05905 [Brevibacterium aurantiacum]
MEQRGWVWRSAGTGSGPFRRLLRTVESRCAQRVHLLFCKQSEETSGYIYCSASNRKKLAKCKPAAWHDYCTYSPDQPEFRFGDARLTVDFRGPCARHDMAIQSIVKKGGSLSSKKSKRRSADSTFKSRMFQNCDNKFSSSSATSKAVKKTCRKTATTYYKTVANKTESWNGKAP